MKLLKREPERTEIEIAIAELQRHGRLRFFQFENTGDWFGGCELFNNIGATIKVEVGGHRDEMPTFPEAVFTLLTRVLEAKKKGAGR